MVYQWRPGTHPKVEAQVAGEHLERLRESNGGLTARLVVDDAKAEDSPIHAVFEWDDTRAADEYRLVQARDVMRHIAVVITDGSAGEAPTMSRGFVVVTENEQDRYESIQIVMDDPALRQQVLTRALRELEAWQKKYAELEEFAGVRASIQKARKKLA